MIRMISAVIGIAFISFLAAAAPAQEGRPKLIRVGIIGCDTSHVPAFTKVLNNPNAAGDLAGFKVTAAFPGGSTDLPSSRDRVQGYTKQLADMGIEIVDSIPKLLEKVDAVLLESVDGRPHLEQVKPVFAAHKPVFIDKPLAGSLADALAIYDLGKQTGTPWFSSSSLRFAPGIWAMRDNAKVGPIIGCDAWGPCPTEPHHPDLFWYGIHGVEILYTIMGEGCTSVQRTSTKGTDVVVGQWKDGRIGVFRGIRDGKSDYGAIVFGGKGIERSGSYGGYEPLIAEIAKFFRTGKVPVPNEETIELIAFMEAADQSKKNDGAPVQIQAVIQQARAAAK